MVEIDPELPGGRLVAQGLRDLAAGTTTIPALVVAIGSPRLRELGLPVPPGPPEPEHELYRRLSAESGDDAHSRYNGLIRTLVSFERAAEAVAAERPSGAEPVGRDETGHPPSD